MQGTLTPERGSVRAACAFARFLRPASGPPAIAIDASPHSATSRSAIAPASATVAGWPARGRASRPTPSAARISCQSECLDIVFFGSGVRRSVKTFGVSPARSPWTASATAPRSAPRAECCDPLGRSPLQGGRTVVGIQSLDRVKGTKLTRIMERIRVSLGVIFSITLSCCGA